MPQFGGPLCRLTEQHRELEDEPLHLATAFQPAPPRDQQDVYLFEVIDGWGEGNPDKELFETRFEPNGCLQTGFDQRLHLILTTPAEFRTAMEEPWAAAQEIVNAVRCADYEVLYSDEVGRGVLDRLVEAARGREAASHG